MRTIGLVSKTIRVFPAELCAAILWLTMECTSTQPCLFTHSQVSLIALGPLSNLALAVRLDPTLLQKLKDLYIMGGNMEGKKMSCSTKTGHLKWMAANCTFHISDYVLHKNQGSAKNSTGQDTYSNQDALYRASSDHCSFSRQGKSDTICRV